MKINLLRAFMIAMLFLSPAINYAQTPSLGNAASFVLFTTNGAMTCSGTKYLTHLTGNVGSNLPGSVTGFGNVDGVMHTADVTTAMAVPDVISLYTSLSTAIPTAGLASPFGGGSTLVAGVYHAVGAATLTGTLTLDGQGDPNAVFIFQVGGVLTTNSLSKIKLINGALACNVFWQIAGAVNVGPGTTMRGTIVANGQIDMTSTLDTLEGRALAMNAAVLVSQLVAYTPIGCGSPYLTGPAAPPMTDSTAAYGVFSSIGAVTSTPITFVIGNVGGNSAAPTGFVPANVTGTIHSMDPSTAATAGDLTLLYNYMVAMPADIDLLDPANFGHDLVLTPHSYQITGITQQTGNLYLNAEGNVNAVFVIKVNGSYTTSTLSKIILINGAQAKNVYWKIDGAVDIYSNSVFNGTLVVAGAISLETGDTLNGRAMTIGGAVAINGSYVRITPRSCSAQPINGTFAVCKGDTTRLTDSTAGGKWTNSQPTIARIDSLTGLVTGLTPGLDTITYTTIAGCTAIAPFTVNPTPSIITGANNVCIGSTITLADSIAGGIWTSSNNLMATAGSATGIITGVSAGTPTITYALPAGCYATKSITVNPTPNAGTITGPSVVCIGSTITLTDTAAGGLWTASNTNASVIGGTVTGLVAGIDTIKYTITNTCGTATATKIVTVNPSAGAGTISGPSTVCAGSTITLTDGVAGGIWSASNTTATVVAGLVTGVTAGTDTISYSVTTSCGTAIATKTITVNAMPNSGTISGPSSVCVGSTITLTDGAADGVWSASNATATVAGGIVTGITTGIDTISYTVTNGCGIAISTKIININSASSAGTISGPGSVCEGSTITLTDATPGGIWTISNARATIIGGIVTGVIAGLDTVSYTVTSTCGTAVATKVILVSPLPVAGFLSGPSAVCEGSTITLTDFVAGGSWSASNGNATVSGGIVSGVTAGIDTIAYTVTNSCGSAVATKSITINAIPSAGTIAGPANVCVGATVTLTETVAGGTWNASSGNATVTGGDVTGITPGTDIISYMVTVAGCTSMTTKTMTINANPDAGIISGPSSVCAGSSITLTDGSTGGTWTSSNATATVAAGVVTGVTAGIDTIMYSVTNLCGTATTSKIITVNPMPNAGTISGPISVCVGTIIMLTDPSAGGIWSSSNTNATVTGGIVTGVAAGSATITYTVNNICGTSFTTKFITINPQPFAGVVTGSSNVCVGSSISLTPSVSGGTWTSNNASATVSTSGVVTGVVAGIDTIVYAISNVCGIARVEKIITINPLPNAGSIVGAASLCVGATVILTDAVAGGTWSSNNSNATVIGGTVTGITAGLDTIAYTVVNVCGTDRATKVILINPLPYAGIITGPSAVCVGSTITMSNVVSTGAWSASNSMATIGSTGVVTGVTAGTVIISYMMTNICGTDIVTKSITVNALPLVPIITTRGPSAACTGTMAQNFGTATLPPAFTTYKWSATNSVIWAQGAGHQYALVNFIASGTATVKVTATITATGCQANSAVITIPVSTSVAQIDQVSYFNNHFVCTPANDATYQWGYDDTYTLDSTILTGEINQDYLNTSPDFYTKSYWVMTTNGDCMQKTYYHTPTAIATVNNGDIAISLYPNPATATITIAVTAPENGVMEAQIVNMQGQTVMTVQLSDNKGTVDVATLPAGAYQLSCFRNGHSVATTRFIKN